MPATVQTRFDHHSVAFRQRRSKPIELGWLGLRARDVGLAFPSRNEWTPAERHVRENNEGHYLAVRFQWSLETLCTNIEEGVLDLRFGETGYGMLVADGMGGLAAGEVASHIALCNS